MTVFTVTPIYAAALAILFVILSFRVVNGRRSGKISLGDGGDPGMLQRIRAHGNCAEYAPMGLLLMALAEGAGAHTTFLHGVGVMLLAGRILHAVGVSASPQIMNLRVGGMALTYLALMAAAALNLNAALL